MKWIILGGAGGAASSTPVPNQPTITIRGYRYLPADADGRIYVEVLATIEPPDPVGSYEGAHIWLQNPDSYGAEDFGGPGLEFDQDELGAPWAPELMTWVAAGEECRFKFAAPDTPRYVRVYPVASSQDKVLSPVEKGQPGETPSVAFQVDPPPAGALGREYAPVVTGLHVTLEYDTNKSDSGTQYWRAKIVWDWPRTDPTFSTLGGVDVAVNDGDPDTEDIQASPSVEFEAETGSFTTAWAEVPAAPAPRRIELYSFDTSGRRNSYQYGITPTHLLTIQRQSGGSGQEYAPLVTPGTPFVEIVPIDGADGSRRSLVRTNWTKPNDSRFGGVYVWYERPDGVRRCVGGSALPPTEHEFTNPTTVQNWTWYVVSADAAGGRQNTIVPGVTPSQTISVGTTAGQLNMAKGINYNSARFQQSGAEFDMKTGAISSDYLSTGGIDIGSPSGGGTPWFRMRDSFGALLAIMGDFTSLIVGGFVGSWFKRLWIGGSSPSNAKIKCDTNGDVSITDAVFSLIKNSIRILIDAGTQSGAYPTYYGLRVDETTGAYPTAVCPGQILVGAQDGVPRIRIQARSEPISGPGSSSIAIQTGAGVDVVFLSNLIGLLLTSRDATIKDGQLIILDAGNVQRLAISSAGIVDFSAARSAASGAGGATALPATPLGYLDATVSGTAVCIPYYSR